jgi:hypothetical protein
MTFIARDQVRSKTVINNNILEHTDTPVTPVALLHPRM